MSLPVLADPSTGEIVAVEDQCRAIVAAAKTSESVAQIRDWSHRLAAIDEYLIRTSTEGRKQVAGAMRLLEVRIGELIGPATPGRPPSGTSVATDISKDERHDFRTMAAAPEVVHQVVEQSTNENPASRRQVVQAIRGDATPPDPDPYDMRGDRAYRINRETWNTVHQLPEMIDKSIACWDYIDEGDHFGADGWSEWIGRAHAALGRLEVRTSGSQGIRRVK